MIPRKPLFLDRDGVLNVDRTPYVSSPDELELFPWTVDALALLDRAGFDLYVISNQQGVPLGMTPPEALPLIDEKIQSALRPMGFEIRRFYYCTALDSAGDPCRKPSPGMILQARDDFALDLEGAWFIGDKVTDVECAVRAGCRPLLVLSGVAEAGEWKQWKWQPEQVCANLLEAARLVVSGRS